MNREELMYLIQQAGFALVDANLFLDSHPQNQMALDYFTDVQRQYTELQAEYEMMFGLSRLSTLILSKAGPGYRLLGLGNWRHNLCGCMKEDLNTL